jgi:hypothetical protein
MMRSNGAATMAALALCLLVGGCVRIGPERATEVPPDLLDDGAARLHDLSGALLLFEAAYHRLPASLDELARVTALEARTTTDPVTGRPFAYERDGFARSDHVRLVIVAAPKAGSELMWAVSVTTGATVTAEVVTLPASSYGELLGSEAAAR